MKKIGLVYEIDDHDAMALMSKYTIVHAKSDDEAGMAALLSEVDAVILRAPARISAAQISAAPQLKVIAALGAGTENIDSAAARAHGIPVLNSSGVTPQPIALYTLGGMILGYRRLFRANARLVSGEMVWSERGSLRGPDISGVTVEIIGYGHIGRAVGALARTALDAKVVFYDPIVTEPQAGATKMATLHELLEASDVVSLHVPLVDATRGMLGREELKKIGRNGLLVNTARGAVVDFDALCETLGTGELGGAVIDVYASEPPDNADVARLAALPNVFLTPHLAGQTIEAHLQRERYIAGEVVRILDGSCGPAPQGKQARARRTLS